MIPPAQYFPSFRHIMDPHQTSNGHQDWGSYRLTLPSSPPPAAPNSFCSLYSPNSADQVLFAPPLHHLQPPPTPRLQSVPLPDLSPPYITIRAPPTGGDVFPIDLLEEIDFEGLARGFSNFAIPPRTTVYVLPAARDRSLLQIDTGDRRAHAFSVLRRLQSILRAPLSLNVYRTQLRPAIQESVRQCFLSHSGPNGMRLWQGFLNGFENPDGPRGEVLLQGHSYMWGFSPDHGGTYMIHVDVSFV